VRFVVDSWVTKAPNDLASHFPWHSHAFTDGQLLDTITPMTGTRTKTTPPSACRTRLGPRTALRIMAGGLGLLPQESCP
jgi:hypothetical protein